MFRVIRSEGRSRTVVTVDRQFSGDSVDVVEVCCQHAISKGKRVHLFLCEGCAGWLTKASACSPDTSRGSRLPPVLGRVILVPT